MRSCRPPANQKWTLEAQMYGIGNPPALTCRLAMELHRQWWGFIITLFLQQRQIYRCCFLFSYLNENFTLYGFVIFFTFIYAYLMNFYKSKRYFSTFVIILHNFYKFFTEKSPCFTSFI